MEAALNKYKKRNEAKELEALVAMVGEGKHGSLACLALVKVCGQPAAHSNVLSHCLLDGVLHVAS